MKERRRKFIRDIARQRIEILFSMAEKIYRENRELGQRYIDIALRISRRTNVRIPKELKRRICKHCKQLLIPGFNCRVRLRQKREPHVVIYCFKCKRYMRYPYKKKQ